MHLLDRTVERLKNHFNSVLIWVFDVQRWHTSILLAFMPSRKFTICTKLAIFRLFSMPYFLMDRFSAVCLVDHCCDVSYSSLQVHWSVQMALCNPGPRVTATLARAGIPDMIGLSWYFVRVHDAVQVCLSHLQAEHLSEMEKSSPKPRKRASHARWSCQDQDGHPSPWRSEAPQSDQERLSLISSVDGAM